MSHFEEHQAIIVTTDFSEGAQSAFSVAKELSNKTGMKIELLHIINPNFIPPVYYQEIVNAKEIARLRNNIKQKLNMELISNFPDAENVTPVLLDGIPFRKIIEYAKQSNAAMIVMSTHGHSAFNHILFGSTVERVVRKSPIPVLTVPSVEKEIDLP